MLNKNDIKLIHPKQSHSVVKGFSIIFILAVSGWINLALAI